MASDVPDDLTGDLTGDVTDPYATPEASPAHRRTLTVAAFVLAAVSLVLVPPVTGMLGMSCGLVAHVKGDRLGFKAAVVAGLAMIAGMALDFFITR